MPVFLNCWKPTFKIGRGNDCVIKICSDYWKLFWIY